MNERSIAILFRPRLLAYAIFQSQTLVFWQEQSAPGPLDKSADLFSDQIISAIDHFNVTSAVLLTTGRHRRSAETAKGAIRKHGTPLFEVAESELFKSFGVPSLKDRATLRQLITAIFPQLSFAPPKTWCFEAVALGVHFETERILTPNDTEQ